MRKTQCLQTSTTRLLANFFLAFHTLFCTASVDIVFKMTFTLEWKLISFSIVCELVKTHSFILKGPDYSPDYYYPSSETKTDIRRTFLDKRRQNLVAAKRVELIDKYLSNNSVFVDGIMHEKIDNEHKEWTLVNEIETAFRNLIGMDGVKYYFKRDPYWRTWRKVNYPEGDKMVCYKCESSLLCNECQCVWVS